jgi:hypothetical protein
VGAPRRPQWKDRAPRLVTKEDGTNLWVFEGQQIPNVGLNAVAGRPPEEYGVEPTALSQLRPGCYDVDARIGDMNANGVLGSLCFPTVPGFVGELFGRQAAAGDSELAIAMLRAYNDWHIDDWCGKHPGPLHPPGDPAHLGPRGDGPRGAARRPQGLPRHHLRRQPRRPRLPEPARRPLGSRSGRPAPTRARSSASTSAPARA